MTEKEKSIEEYSLKRFDEYSNHIPAHCVDGLRMYLQYGIEPGSFLTFVLCNDLAHASAAADQKNRALLASYGDFLFHAMPTGSWGSESKMDQWLKKGGLRGRDDQDMRISKPEDDRVGA